jgi:hypothetical protein
VGVTRDLSLNSIWLWAADSVVITVTTETPNQSRPARRPAELAWPSAFTEVF